MNLSESIETIERESRYAQSWLEGTKAEMVKPKSKLCACTKIVTISCEHQGWRFPCMKKHIQLIQEQVEILKSIKAEIEKSRTVTIKKVSSSEENVSNRHTSFDLYVNESYHSSYSDIIDAMDAKKRLEKI